MTSFSLFCTASTTLQHKVHSKRAFDTWNVNPLFVAALLRQAAVCVAQNNVQTMHEECVPACVRMKDDQNNHVSPRNLKYNRPTCTVRMECAVANNNHTRWLPRYGICIVCFSRVSSSGKIKCLGMSRSTKISVHTTSQACRYFQKKKDCSNCPSC